MTEPTENLVAEEYASYQDVQLHLWNLERRKTRSKLWITAAIFLASDLVALSIGNVLNAQTLMASLLFPMILFGLGAWAFANPKPAVIVAAVLVLAMFGLQFYLTGASSLLMGLLMKGVIAYLLFAAWTSAREAETAKRNLKG